MREILYKAKKKNDGEWVEGYYVKAKIKEYEDKLNVIKVGDEVVKNDDISKCGVVTYIKVMVRGNKYSVLWDDGWSCWYYEKEIKKTDRHFPQVEKLLKAMKEGQ